MSNTTKAPNVNTEPGVPFSQEAEEAVIGAVLIDPECHNRLKVYLKPSDFFMLRHQYIWNAFERISERGEPIDHIMLAEELENMRLLDTIGGRAYIIQLANNTGTSMYAEVYGRLVERTSIRRQLLLVKDEIDKLARDERLNIDTVISQSQEKLLAIQSSEAKNAPQLLGDVLSDYYDNFEYALQNKEVATGIPTGYRDLDTVMRGFHRGDLWTIAGRPGTGKCVTGDTNLITGCGIIPIASLKPDVISNLVDDEGGVYYPLEIDVLTKDGIVKTSHFYDAGAKPTLKITTRAGYKISGTVNHRVLVLNKQAEKVWVRLEDLGKGDFVAIQRFGQLFGNKTELPPSTHVIYRSGYTLKAVLPTELTPDFAYFLGILAGDGGLTRKGVVSFTSSDKELLEVFYDWGAKLGLNPKLNAKYDHRMSSTMFYHWLQEIGLSGYSHEKTIPNIILQSPADCIIAFLQGLFDTDAHADKRNGYVEYVTTSENLAHQVHVLLLQFGIVSRLHYKANEHRGAWVINISGDNARIFFDCVGFRLSRKQERRNNLSSFGNGNLDVIPYLPVRQSKFPKTERANYYRYFDGKRAPSYKVLGRIAQYAPEVNYLLEPEYYWDEVDCIEDSGVQHCYDLVVPSGHNYVANGIVSHNTSMMLCLAGNVARFGGRVLFPSLEMPLDQLITRLLAMETGVNVAKLRDFQLTAQEASRVTEAIGRLASWPIWVWDVPTLTVNELRTNARRIKYEHGLDLLLVDYVQLMNEPSIQNNRVQEISHITRNMKVLARELNVTVVQGAQLSRAVEQRADKRPILSDLRESGSLEQDSDIVMFLYRDEMYNEDTEFPNQTDLIVGKHRNGPTGTISLYFEKSLTKFMDASVHRVDLNGLE